MVIILDIRVVALFLSMSVVCNTKPMGYDYPTPKVPFIEGPTVSTTTPIPPPPTQDYDEYDPADIPEDQAAPAPQCIEEKDKDNGKNQEFLASGVPLCPSEEISGYEYPVPENPLTLPTKPTTAKPALPECVRAYEKDLGMNSAFIDAGVPLCPEEYDEYDPNDIPTDQAMPPPDCISEDQKDEGMNPEYLNNGVPLCPTEELPGYEYPVPEISFTLPPKITTTTTTSTTPVPLPECILADEQYSGNNPEYLGAGVPLCPEEYDEYDPNDIPTDQAAPPPECIPADQKNQGMNPVYLDNGVPLCPSEESEGYEYPVPEIAFTLPPKIPTTTILPSTTTSTTPEPLPECILAEEQYSGNNPEYLEAGVPLCPEEYDEYDPNDIPTDQSAPPPECVLSDQKDQGLNQVYLDSGIPLCPSEEAEGYEYPVPEISFTLPPKLTTTELSYTTTSTTQKPIPECIQVEEQDLGKNPEYLGAGVPLCPTEEIVGYEYPEPEVPLTLPPKTSTTTSEPLPPCIKSDEKDSGKNPSYLDNGIPLCPEEYDEYDPNDIPSDQAAPPPECVPADQKDQGMNPQFIQNGVPLCPSEEPEGYEYSVPEIPFTLPPKITTSTLPPITTTLEQQPECISTEEQDLGENLKYIEAGVPLCPEEYDEYDPNDIPTDQAAPPPECVPADQKDQGINPEYIKNGIPICPSEEPEGYEYPVPKIPFTLPPKTTTIMITTTTIPTTSTSTTPDPIPECIPSEEQNSGNNPEYLEIGVPLCPFLEPADYEYPKPECIPAEEKDFVMNLDFIADGVPLCPEEYDEYDPNDIPTDQAMPPPDCIAEDQKGEGMNPEYLKNGVPLCPSEELPGYEYPVPEIPFTLPSKISTTTVLPSTTTSTAPKPLPECILAEDQYSGNNPEYLEAGVPLCPEEYDEYDPNDIPTDQAAPPPECVPSDQKDQEMNPIYIDSGVPLCPSEKPEGYEYTVPEIPFTLPPKQSSIPTTPLTTTTPKPSTELPDCIVENERDVGDNPSFISAGVPLCPSDEPEGYEYPTPANPFTLPTTSSTTPEPEIEFDDYNPNDIPEDQAKPLPECILEEEQNILSNKDFISAGVPICPTNDPEGYEYPVPEIPFTLPTNPPSTPKLPLPNCVTEEEKDVEPNPQLISQGVPICPPEDLPSYQPSTTPASQSYDEYDASDIPSDQAEPLPDCVQAEDQEIGSNPRFISAGVPICPSEETEGYSYNVPDNPLQLPQRNRKSKALSEELSANVPVTESGLTITGVGRVFSFHLPKLGDQTGRTMSKVGADVILLPPSSDKNIQSQPSMGSQDSGMGRDDKVKKSHKKNDRGNKKKKKNKGLRKAHNKSKSKVDKKPVKDINEKQSSKIQIQPSRPREGKNAGSRRKGKQAISVRAWLARGR